MANDLPRRPRAAQITFSEGGQSWWAVFARTLIQDWEDLAEWIKGQLSIVRPMSTQSVAAGDTIQLQGGVSFISSAGSLSMTSTPTISAANDGQVVRVFNRGNFSITLQDEAAVAGSKLRIPGGSVTLPPFGHVSFVYFADSGEFIRL